MLKWFLVSMTGGKQSERLLIILRERNERGTTANFRCRLYYKNDLLCLYCLQVLEKTSKYLITP